MNPSSTEVVFDVTRDPTSSEWSLQILPGAVIKIEMYSIESKRWAMDIRANQLSIKEHPISSSGYQYPVTHQR